MPLLPYHADTLLVFRVDGPNGQHKIRIHATKIGNDGVYDLPAAQLAGKLNAAGDNTVAQTASGFLAVVAPLYAADSTIALDHVASRQDDGSYQPIALGGVAPVVGTDGATQTGGTDAAKQTTYNMRDTAFNRVKVQFMCARQWRIAPIGGTGAGGDPTVDAIVAFMSSQNHPVVSKHGLAIQAMAHVTFTLNRRLRRRSGLA